MRALPRILYFVCLVGLALVGALAFAHVAEPSMATVLTRAVFVAAVCAAPGLVYRRLWPLALVLLPIGCYLLVRTVVPVPELVKGAGGQYHFYVEQLRLGTLAYRSEQFPLSLSDAPELQLLLAFCFYWLVGAAAFLALSLRRPLPAVALILVLLGYSMTVDDSVRILWPAVLFVVLAAGLFVLSRGLKRSGWRLRDAVAGGAVGVVASLLALLLLTSAPSAAAAAWKDWRAWDPFGSSSSVFTFNWLENYPLLLDPGRNVDLMKVQSPVASYWKANSLDSFNGSAWFTSQAFIQRIEAQSTGDGYLFTIPPADVTPPGKTVTEVFAVESSVYAVYTPYLFTGGDPRTLTIHQEITLRMNRMRSLRVSTPLGPTAHYTLTATVPQIKPADLVGLGNDYPDDLDAYLTLPFPRVADIAGPDKEATWRSTVPDSFPGGSEWVDLYALNRQIIGDATDPYDITLRIERHLRQSYDYSLAPPASTYSSPYAAFLFDTRTGYCQHFAGAMALLLRYNGIPSRVAVGFATGEYQGAGLYLVSSNNAHAWVEAYFPTVGWVPFDPTPGRNLPAGASSSSPGFLDPFATNTTGTATVTTELPRENLPKTGGDENQTSSAHHGSWLSRATWLPWVGGLVVLVAGWPVARGLWRRRRLHRGTWEQRLQASLGLLRTDLMDYRAPVSAAQTLEEMLRTVRAHVGLEPDLGLIERAEAVLFGGREAGPQDIEKTETLRREVQKRLRKRHGWIRAGLTWYGVPRVSLGGAHRA